MIKQLAKWVINIFKKPNADIESICTTRPFIDDSINQSMSFKCCGKGCSSHNENMKRYKNDRRHNHSIDPSYTASFYDAGSSSSSSSSGNSGD